MTGRLPEHVDESDPDAPWNDVPEHGQRPKIGECAVCGTPTPAALPPRKDFRKRFCDDHGPEDLADVPEPEGEPIIRGDIDE